MRHRSIGRSVLVAAGVVALAGLGGGVAANADDGSFAQAPVNVTRPLVSGAPVEGATLTTTGGEWTGTEPITYSYTWRRCDADGFNCSLIEGATEASYTVGANDIGSTIRVRVIATNVAGEAGLNSLPTEVVQAPPVNVTRPLVSGAPVEGATLTTTSGEWTGTEPITYSYTWRRCDADGFNCSLIEGATEASYTVVANDIGSTIRARVTATNVAGEAGRRSLPTEVVHEAPPTEGGDPCGAATSPPADGWAHVVWVVFENKTYDDVIGSPNAPYINALAGKCGLATSFYAESHPSLPNYIAMTSGSTQGVIDDAEPAAHPLDVSTIFSQLGSDGWRSLEESMPSNCYLANSGVYAVRHNPAAYYTNIRADCANRDVPLGATPDLSARFTFVTPNLCHDMHSCPTQSDAVTEVKTGDAWLSTFLPEVLGSPEYAAGSTAVFITWDEGTGNDQHIPTLVVSPSTPAGATSTTTFDHYSMLRTTEEMLGLTTYLGNAANAASMRSAFGL